jgi:hypothetical protein
MKKLLTLVILLMTTIGFTQNLVTNPTFTNALTGWNSTGTNYALPTHITNDGQDDTFSVKYVATATTGFDQKFSVTPGSIVAISFWYKATRTDGAATGNTARIWSVFTDPSSATPLAPINPPGTTGSTDDVLRNNNTYLPQATTWTQVIVNSQVPVGATTFTLQLRAYNGSTVSFDNISFASPGAVYLSSASFSQIDGLKIYPNPTKNVLNISTNSNLAKTIQVYDMIGKEVINTQIENQLNVSNLTTGMYVAKITEDGKTSTTKLVIQ